MKKIILLFSLLTGLIMITPSCNRNKIACPTYADSFPDQKKRKKNKPDIPKPSKPKSGVLPKGYGK
ncbi:MAG: hypothetical protein JNK66_04395 [Chitinophagales bacterium]|nr:hypothetical protein [Chitinophagales bacterium]